MAETLGALAAATSGTVIGDSSTTITDVTHDSRQVREGTLFVAVPGDRHDGHDFVAEAQAAGAAAVAVERLVESAVSQLMVDSTRARLGRLAARVHHEPSQHLSVAGITGTNGKTTVAHLLESIFTAAGQRPGRIGTTGAQAGDITIPLQHTTPEASDVHRLLARMVTEGVASVAMEVSSHALALGRVEDVAFHVAGFTNLSQDHLDFHETMESYFHAKRELFFRARHAVVCIENKWGRRLEADLRGRVPVMTVGPGGDLRAEQVTSTLSGSTFQLHIGETIAETQVRLAGTFNVLNALVAAGCAVRLGIGTDAITAGLAHCEAVPGRFEVISGGDRTVIVDYAHTPDAIREVIAATRRLSPGRIIVVFGAGGDRDRDKRPLMGEAACAADTAIVTNDNPRSESPELIADAIVGGMPSGCDVIVELDRRQALEMAVTRSGPGDSVLLLGKGHEPGQAFASRVEPFDDRAEAQRVVGELL